MMNRQLRIILKRFAEERGYTPIEPARLINRVSNRTFNFSMEEPILRKYNSYFGFTEPYSYHTIQPCIRMAGFGKMKHGKSAHFHSTLFEMVGFCQFDHREEEFEVLQNKTLEDLWDLFINILKLDPARLKVHYFAGGKISRLLDVPIAQDFEFPPDKRTKEFFCGRGLSEDQLIPSFDVDRLLITFPLPGDFYVGFRPEIFYQDVCGQYFEIGTIEFIRWKKVNTESGILIQSLSAVASVFVFGVERILVAVNHFGDSFEVDSIQPLMQEVEKRVKNADRDLIRHFVDALRALHAIIADGGTYVTLPSRHIKGDFRELLKALADGFIGLQISVDLLPTFLQINARLNPWKNELLSSISAVVKEFQEYQRRQTEALKYL